MKTSILSTTVAALLAAIHPVTGQEAQTAVSSSTTTASSDGAATATVTIDVNGKKETRTFKLGDGEPRQIAVSESQRPEGAEAKEKETWIGIGVGAPISAEVRAQLPLQPGEGITVSHVAPESPAAKAGLAQHDILVRLDDQVLVTGEQFKTLVKMRKPGEVAKVAYFRRGERMETEVTFAEHQVSKTTGAEDVLRLLGQAEKWTMKGVPASQWQEKLQSLREKSGVLKDRLKEAKDMFPGVIVDKQAFLLGVDGTVKKLEGELQNIEGIMKHLRDTLEKADIPPEKIEDVRKAVEGAIEKAGEAARRAAGDAIREYEIYREFKKKRSEEKNPLEAPKPGAPTQPVNPPPPISTPQ